MDYTLGQILDQLQALLREIQARDLRIAELEAELAQRPKPKRVKGPTNG